MWTVIKTFRRKMYRNSSSIRSLWFLIRFLSKNRYIPNFKSPKTFNEKINFRKIYPEHELFSICSDKIAAKEWVSNRIGSQYVIPNYFVGKSIDLKLVKKILRDKGNCYIKANHNSGTVFSLKINSTDSEIEAACEDVEQQLGVDYGKLSNERWYSEIEPRILIEKQLEPEEGETDIRDYKFHVFKCLNGCFNVILQVDFCRSSYHNRSYFDEDLNWLPFSVEYPLIRTNIAKPKNYQLMLDLAKKLAEPFSYVRVDFYNVAGSLFFGELTFAHGSGIEKFSHKAYDIWMGYLWEGDPRI